MVLVGTVILGVCVVVVDVIVVVVDTVILGACVVVVDVIVVVVGTVILGACVVSGRCHCGCCCYR